MVVRPKVSILIPVYNSERYIIQAIESILDRSDPNNEIIVVNDGSTDRTAEVLQPYIDRIRYIEQTNQGVAAARNHGIEESQGELIAFLDADDFFLPDKLAVQVTRFEAEPELGMTVSGWHLVNADGEFISTVEPWHHAPEFNLETAIVHKPARPSATMVRRTWCERVGGFDTRFSIGEDLDFLLRLMVSGCPADWVRQSLICYRQHDRSLMSRGMEVVRGTQAVMERFFARPDLPESIRALKNIERYQCWLWLACRTYYDGDSEQMGRCLHQALHYSPYRKTQTVDHWVASFAAYARQYGRTFDMYALSHSPPWQQTIDRLLSSKVQPYRR